MAKKGKDDADQDPTDLVATARGLAEIVSEHQLTELVIESQGTTITVRREPARMQLPPPAMQFPPQAVQFQPPAMAMPMASGPSAQAAPASSSAPAVDDTAHVVTSPFVGTFYRKPNPDSPNYVSINDRVEKGAALCIVEAMKLMNEIEADASGTIIGILVEDGASVEYGQPLFKIRT
jgi:acetyl-CoA carboxylase biotin carboxyl carrier protein